SSAADPKGRSGARSIIRACTLLKLVGQSQDNGASLNELAAATKVPKSSAHRYLQVLEEEGLIERTTGGRYRLGASFISLQTGDVERLVERARPYLAAIRDRFGETVNLGMLSANQIVYLEILESGQSMRLAARQGDTEGIHSTALGKAIAATLPDRDVLAILRHTGMAQTTPRTIVTPEDYLRELERVRVAGYAIDDRENEEEGRCVAVYLPGCGRQVAISLSAVANRFSLDQAREAAESLRIAAIEISGLNLRPLKIA
ncbi:MAG: IclR family transcriptional regulator, partial [Sphingomonadales bacterium]